jgi:hypothetical protein
LQFLALLQDVLDHSHQWWSSRSPQVHPSPPAPRTTSDVFPNNAKGFMLACSSRSHQTRMQCSIS